MPNRQLTYKVKVDSASAVRDLKKVSKSVDELVRDVDKLSGEDATIQLKLAQEDLGRQLADITADVATLDSQDATIDLKMAEGDRLIASAKAEINQEVMRAKETLRSQVATLAVAGAEKILRREVDAKSHADLLRAIQAEL